MPAGALRAPVHGGLAGPHHALDAIEVERGGDHAFLFAVELGLLPGQGAEAQARAQGYNVKVGKFPFIGNGKAIALGEAEGFVKTVFDAKTGELLGAHMVGAEVTELIQGYTDHQGSASYNMKLGLKRAETVKAELLNAGVAEHRMKVMSLGEDGVLCVDNSDICGNVNRRVHLEMRKFGQEHMVVPAPATSTDPTATGIDASPNGHKIELSTDDLHQLSPEPTPGS